MSSKEVSEGFAFELMMKETPYSNKYDSGSDGVLPECRTCRFHRPNWIFETCVYKRCPYSGVPISTRRPK